MHKVSVFSHHHCAIWKYWVLNAASSAIQKQIAGGATEPLWYYSFARQIELGRSLDVVHNAHVGGELLACVNRRLQQKLVGSGGVRNVHLACWHWVQGLSWHPWGGSCEKKKVPFPLSPPTIEPRAIDGKEGTGGSREKRLRAGFQLSEGTPLPQKTEVWSSTF